jgi:hypothetical protein
MGPKCKASLGGVVLVAGMVFTLAAMEVNAAWTAPVPKDKLPAFAIPRMSKPPTIDGRIEDEEWQEAVAISGIGGCTDAVLYARPTTYLLAWDAGHLYMAVRTWVKPGYKPRVSGREPGAAGVFDDSAEFHFQPLGKNVAPGRTDSSYKFIVNALGFSGDYMRIAVGQQFKNWLPTFDVAAGMTPEGSAPQGGRWLEIEWAADTTDFELTGPNQAGDKWKLMLGFNHMYHGWAQGRIAAITSYFDPGGYPVGTLVENTPAVQFLQEDLPGPMDGVAAAKVKVFNPTDRPTTVNILAEYSDADGAALLKKQEALTVEPHKTAVFALNEKFLAELKGKGSIVYVASMGDQELLRYFTLFTTAYPAEALAPAKPSVQAFPLQATFNPVRSNVMLVVDSYYLPDPSAAKEVTYRIAPDGGGKPVAEGVITNAVTNYYRKLIQLPALKAGTLHCRGYYNHKRRQDTRPREGPVQEAR